ncbi:hypothetical protein NMY22_g5883 [Coprinellus aureogranulatus]|nr:hypothetical protein NMY22_g5883 [Coprinellus aureogranulatus]
MASAVAMLSSYDLDKRFPPISMSSSMYGATYATSAQTSALFFDSNNMWPGDSLGHHDYPQRRWAEHDRPTPPPYRGFITFHDAGFSRVPRSTGFLDSPSTDSSELSDHSSPGLEPWGFPSYDGRASPQIKRSRSSTGTPDWSSGQHISVPPYNSQWANNIIVGPDSSITAYSPEQTMLLGNADHRYLFPDRFPDSCSPPPMYQETTSPIAIKTEPRASPASLGSAESPSPPGPNVKRCSHCKATQTPLWRRDPTTFKPLCNACGLYLQQRNRLRPQVLIDADADDDSSEEVDQNYTGPECSHCRTHHTSVWRRSKQGEQLCNACGVYLRLRGKPRPLSLKRNKIKPRSKHPKP